MEPDVLPELPPQEYWDDSEWANEHFADIVQQYPDLWVAIVDKHVVAAGKVIAEVQRCAEERTQRKHFPIIFAEKIFWK
jgi:hypothetical protein